MKILILGGGGFIGGHLARHHKEKGNWVRIADQKYHEYFKQEDICDEFMKGDLRDRAFTSLAMWSPDQVNNKLGSFDRVYQLAADMGGAGYVFSGDNDANIMWNNAMINLNIAHEAVREGVKKLFYSSSSCIYPTINQLRLEEVNCSEDSAYPANPDSEYGWEKLYSERVYQTFARNHGLNVRIARFHNIFGTHGVWKGGKEKAPAAICRKVEMADREIEIWGDGQQARSFLFNDECVEGIERLMDSDFAGPVNIGSTEMVTINQLAEMVIKMSGKNLGIKNVPGPVGVRARNSDNRLIKEKLGWQPASKLQDGLLETYSWIRKQINEG